MDFQYLAQVHTARNAGRVQENINRRTVFQEWHVFFTHNPGNHTLVAMPSGHLVTRSDLAALRDGDAHHHIHTGREVGVIFPGKDFHIHNLPALAMRHAQGGIFHIARLFAKNSPQQALLRRQFFFAFGRDLADQDIVRANFRTDTNDAAFVEVFDGIFTNVWNIPGDLFGAELGITRFHFIFFNVDRGKAVFLNQSFRNHYGVFEIGAFPRHESHGHVLA